MMVELVNAGLATATAERMVTGNRTIEVARMRITEVGRRALEGAAMSARGNGHLRILEARNVQRCLESQRSL
jgi:hypothetical protein